ncbi:MAG: Clp protease ClpS [Chloroflexi bacterium]|jgi:ATP-dependent Clp protease adapter protein ClpS|nr:Clp protease ClpS [Chloroflexota bacterium]
MSVTTVPEQELLEQLRAKLTRPYHVIIHDDPIHTYHDVAEAVHRTIPGKSYKDGWDIATLVDTTGQAIATTCPKEPAEHYRERFERAYGLTSTIEAV